MTREEAIFCEKSYRGETNCVDCKYYGTNTCLSRESHRMAIKALEQEPVLNKIKSIVAKWKMDTWTDNLSYECMAKIAELVEPQESEE